MALARSSYFYHRTRLSAGEKYVEVRRTITDIFERNHCCYGYRRIQASLVRQCLCVSEKVVRRLMKQESLVAAVLPAEPRYLNKSVNQEKEYERRRAGAGLEIGRAAGAGGVGVRGCP